MTGDLWAGAFKDPPLEVGDCPECRALKGERCTAECARNTGGADRVRA